MKLIIDLTGKKFLVTKAVGEKKEQNGRQKLDKVTGLPLWTVQVTALDESGAEVINVVMASLNPPKLAVDSFVTPVELEAIPWATGGRNGVAYRAKQINAPATNAKAS